ncbi:MAG: co-chaperone YbbN [Rhodospirillales bacterium]|nr:co-chaperone YbbN [Rhodospirillales bacterium]
MFGSKPQRPQDNAQNIIFDVNAADFEARVMAASVEKPVIVDFWAPWCGPCKQLMPTLERVVNAAGGEVLLAKVNLDHNPELAQALRVQSVPTVFAFFGGRPVDAFQGAQPESSVQAFVDRLVQAARASQPGAIDIDEMLKIAAEGLAAGDLQTAQSAYAQILQQDEKNAPAYAGMVRTFIAADMVEQARGLIDNAPEEIAKSSDFAAARTALELAQNAPSSRELRALEQKVQAHPEDMDAKCALAEVQFGAGQKDAAIETLLAAIVQDREWNDQEARKTLLRFFEALGNADPLTIAGRKKLSRLLFS